jgi:phosphinothricin acetyltransferase
MSLPILKAVIDDLPAIVKIYNSTIESRAVTADLTPVAVEDRAGSVVAVVFRA